MRSIIVSFSLVFWVAGIIGYTNECHWQDLDTLGTHPDYWRRGAGSLLVKWGCDLADADGVSAYVDASKDGAPLYAKYGFVDEGSPDDEIASMARRKR